jgi:hypothetical protein
MKKGQKVKVIASQHHAPFRSEHDSRALVGRDGVATGRSRGRYIEVTIISPLSGRPYAYLMDPSELEEV